MKNAHNCPNDFFSPKIHSIARLLDNLKSNFTESLRCFRRCFSGNPDKLLQIGVLIERFSSRTAAFRAFVKRASLARITFCYQSIVNCRSFCLFKKDSRHGEYLQFCEKISFSTYLSIRHTQANNKDALKLLY